MERLQKDVNLCQHCYDKYTNYMSMMALYYMHFDPMALKMRFTLFNFLACNWVMLSFYKVLKFMDRQRSCS